MNKDQINSLVRSILKIVGAILAAHGATKYAAFINTEDVAGVIITLVGMWLSHQTHADSLLSAFAKFAQGQLPPNNPPIQQSSNPASPTAEAGRLPGVPTKSPIGVTAPAAAAPIAEVTAKAALPSRYPDPV